VQRARKKIKDRLSKLSTEQLRQLVAEPTSHDVLDAWLELYRRGIQATFSLESLVPLLTSADSKKCGLGMFLLDAVNPPVDHRLLQGASNMDSPEVWRERLASLQKAQEQRSKSMPNHGSESTSPMSGQSVESDP